MSGTCRVFVSLLAALGVLALARTARADNLGAIIYLFYAVVVVGIVGLGGIIALIGNAASLSSPRPRVGWIVIGFLFGGSSLLVGVGALLVRAGGGSVVVAGLALLVGALDVGLAIRNARRRRSS